MNALRLFGLFACLIILFIACERTDTEVVPQNTALVPLPSLPIRSSTFPANAYSQVALDLFYDLDNGQQTTVAINALGYGVEVHKESTTDYIWYRSTYTATGGTRADWSTSRKISGDDEEYLRGSDPSIATDGTNQFVLVCRDFTGGLSYALGSFLINNGQAVLTFSNFQPVGMQGNNPAVAVTKSGLVVLSFESERFGELHCLTGQLNGTSINWNDVAQPYGTGYNPTIAINEKGQLIEMHEKIVDYTRPLFVQTGSVCGGSVCWHPYSTFYANGLRPSVALDNDGAVVAVHQSKEGYIHLLVGSIESNQYFTITQDTQLITGNIPSVSLFNNHGRVQVLLTVDDGLNQIRYATNGYR